MNENNLNKKNDIIDAEFVNEDSTQTNNSNSNINENQSNSIKKVNEYHFSEQEFYSSENQQQKFKSFYYSFGNNSNIKLKKPSILKIILLLPFITISADRLYCTYIFISINNWFNHVCHFFAKNFQYI